MDFATKAPKTQSFAMDTFVKLSVLVSWWQKERDVITEISLTLNLLISILS